MDQRGNPSILQAALSSKPQRGRKRFIADLNELKSDSETLSNSSKWSVKNVRSGDEEGTFELDLIESETGMKQSISLMVSDTSEYPLNHSYFGYSLEAGGLDLRVAAIIDELAEKSACTLQDLVKFIVNELSCGDNSEDDEDVEDEQIDDIYFEDEPSQPLLRGVREHGLQLGRLKREFVEAKAAGYNPGIIWGGPDNFILSISIPVIDITKNIPPHALLAWDRHFLEPGQQLTLLISGFVGMYPVVQPDGTLSREADRAGVSLKFKVGLTQEYKPSQKCAMTAFRQFGFEAEALEEEESTELDPDSDDDDDDDDDDDALITNADKMLESNKPQAPEDRGALQRTSLSSSLESLLDQYLLRLVQLRRKYHFGWAAAETLLWQAEVLQKDINSIVSDKKEMCEQADKEEEQLSASYKLFEDPLVDSIDINLLKTSFSFLLRRLALCTRHCIVCHKKLDREYEALKPYVCDSNLCVFQYYSLNLGPSIEQDICNNAETVDLLVSLAYIAATDGVLDEPLPRGMGLRVPPPLGAISESDGLCDFDTLRIEQMRVAIRNLIESLPSIVDMKKYLLKTAASGNTKVKLTDMKPGILPAAWSILKWCVASCTAHIQELTKEEDRVRIVGLGPEYRQFRFMFGSPDKEAKFQKELEIQTAEHANAKRYPTLFAFHGSPIKNWHSIIRHGLWWKSVAHGRSYGHGVYFAKDGSTSLSGYAQASVNKPWSKSALLPSTCIALAEIVNLPEQFVSRDPFYVVSQTDWIMCRYLLVKCGDQSFSSASPVKSVSAVRPSMSGCSGVSYLTQDPTRIAQVYRSTVDIPQPSQHLVRLLDACSEAKLVVLYDDEDRAIYDGPDEEPDPETKENILPQAGKIVQPSTMIEAWKPDTAWLEKNVVEMLPPPTASSPTASVALHRELKAMMREQTTAESKNELAALGWYMPLEYNGDNLYQWILEMHSFGPDLPLSRDMEARGVNSLVFEVRFPPTFPHSPPFFRIIRPRFLPFSQGGGGHVTVGGSICMDLLTSDGWLPSYSVSAVVLQIRLAISNLEPMPARLQPTTWDEPYTPQEALTSYTRAAALHGWRVSNPSEMRKLVTDH